MKRVGVWLLLIMVARSVMADTAADIRATTAQGEVVVLHADGTWESASIGDSLRLDLGKARSCHDVTAADLLACRVTEVLAGNRLEVQIDSPPHVLSSRQTVRLLGTTAPTPESLESYSYESYQTLRQQTLGKTVYLGFDSLLRDSDGTLLGYLYSQQGVCLNALMLERGLLQVDSEAAFHFADEFRQLEASARRQRVGVWSGRVAKVHIKAFFRGLNRYVELANSNDSAERLEGWRLADATGHSISLPDKTLEPSETLRIYSGSDVAGPQLWQGTRDSISLFDADSVLVDRLIYPPARETAE